MLVHVVLLVPSPLLSLCVVVYCFVGLLCAWAGVLVASWCGPLLFSCAFVFGASIAAALRVRVCVCVCV